MGRENSLAPRRIDRYGRIGVHHGREASDFGSTMVTEATSRIAVRHTCALSWGTTKVLDSRKKSPPFATVKGDVVIIVPGLIANLQAQSAGLRRDNRVITLQPHRHRGSWSEFALFGRGPDAQRILGCHRDGRGAFSTTIHCRNNRLSRRSSIDDSQGIHRDHFRTCRRPCRVEGNERSSPRAQARDTNAWTLLSNQKRGRAGHLECQVLLHHSGHHHSVTSAPCWCLCTPSRRAWQRQRPGATQFDTGIASCIAIASSTA